MIKNTLYFLAGAAAMLAFSAAAQTTKWVSDKKGSKVQFYDARVVSSSGAPEFTTYNCTVLADKADFSDAIIDFSIDAQSISTGDVKREAHIRSEDVFDAAKYPKITFKSNSIKKDSNNKDKPIGALTMHGVTKEAAPDVQHTGTKTDSQGNTKASFIVILKFNRSDFGLKYESGLNGAGVVPMGEDVTLICKMELLKQK